MIEYAGYFIGAMLVLWFLAWLFKVSPNDASDAVSSIIEGAIDAAWPDSSDD